MQIKLLLSTFVLVFLAELGDKTQFAAFGLAASSKSIWPVFWGSVLALTLSSLVAVLLGSVLGKFLPEQYVKIGSGLLFILFGVMTLLQAFRGEPVVAETPVDVAGGFLNKVALESAMQFEQETHHFYLELAQECTYPAAQQVFRELALAEKEHHAALDRIQAAHQDVLKETETESQSPILSVDEKMQLQEKIRKAWQHEAETAKFYKALAEKVHIHSLQEVFWGLAQEEEMHQQRLFQLQKQIEES